MRRLTLGAAPHVMMGAMFSVLSNGRGIATPTQTFDAKPAARHRRRVTAAPATAAECYASIGLDACDRAGQYSAADIKRAFKLHVLEVHPDVPGGSEAEFRNARAAFERLFVTPNDMSTGRTDPSAAGRPTSGGFYDHPHARGDPYYQHRQRAARGADFTTTRGRWDDDTGSYTHDHPKWEDLFRTSAARAGATMHEGAAAFRQGTGFSWWRERQARRRAYRAAAFGGGEYGESAADQAATASKQKWAGALARVGIVFFAIYVVIDKGLLFVPTPAYHSRDHYTDEERASLMARPTRAERAARNRTASETGEAEDDRISTLFHEKVPIKLQGRTTGGPAPQGLTYNGVPFTPEGFASMHAARRRKRMASGAGTAAAPAVCDSVTDLAAAKPETSCDDTVEAE